MAKVSLKVFKRDELVLKVQDRDEQGKGPVGRLRRLSGMLPGVLYGHGGSAMSFKVEARTLEGALARGGQDVFFLVQVEGQEGVEERAVVRDIQYHKVRGNILHVDLLRVNPDETLRLQVPLVTQGVPIGVREGGGAMQQSITELELECQVAEMPSRLEIDISDLNIGDGIQVADLLEQEARIVTDPEVSIVNVVVPRLVVEEEVEAEGEEGEGEEGEGEEGEGGEAEGGEAEGGDQG